MRRIVKLLGLGGWLAMPVNPAAAQVIDILHSFSGGANDGQGPQGSLLLSGSTVWGMTQSGGGANEGIVFNVAIDGGNFAVRHSFANSLTDGHQPSGSLVQSGSSLFGMTEAGGLPNVGVIFQIGSSGGGYSVIRSFTGGPTDGAEPFGTLTQSGTTFFGFTSSGGSIRNTTSGNYSNGAIFKMNTDGTGYSLLHSFGGPGDGQLPRSGAPIVSGSSLYGMTLFGGIGGGVVFKMGTDGTGYTILHTFTGSVVGDGAAAYGQMTLVGSRLYGMTGAGGTANHGTIFEIDTDGTGYTVLHSFTGVAGDGSAPFGELTLVGSTLYGTTGEGGTDALGTIFGINTDGSDFELLHSFTGGPNDGAGPSGDLLVVGSNFYGMTSAGGSSNDGVIFSYPVPVPEPSSLLLTAGGALVFLARRLRQRNAKTLELTP
jgi:uncharacterized repeat protein (TIGR03803 family)